MVSAEFNLLYRFHSAISQQDDQWTGKFFKNIFGDKNPRKIGLVEFYQGVAKYEASIPKEPSERVFGGLARNPNTGTFNDADLVEILKESIEDPAGQFSLSYQSLALSENALAYILQALLARGTFPSTCEQWRSWVLYKPESGMSIWPKYEPHADH